MDAQLATLCRACRLCCDGSLFGRVPLEAHEVEPARAHRLHVLADGRAFEQPCSALSPAGCDAYDARPSACRHFVCRLYERHRREGGPLEPRLAAVERTRELLRRLHESGWRTSDFEPGGAAPRDDARAFEELLRRLEEDFARG
jgi:hypothetical protein